ncbi:MAG: efflux RND transporter periplasmic adaptor subunit [Lentisphaeria bacterium]|nr:efflux RND transporter periplasmic adaptor subunit [Lentisphaeria bacterium]
MKAKTVFFRSAEILIGAAVLAGAILFYVKTGTERSINSGRRRAEVPAVKIAEVKISEVEAQVEGIGTGLAKESVDITANATELVVKLFFDDGQTVSKGEQLVQLRDDQYQAELQQLRINLAEQERELKRLTPLYQARITSQKDFDAAKTAVSRARTALGIVEYQIGNRRICAPFAGRLGMRNVSIGDLVTPNTRITTLDDISEIKIDFRVSEKYYPVIRKGQKVGVRSAAFPKRVFEGSITAISPRIDPVTRTAEVRATVPNPDGCLAPGMLFVVRLELGRHSSLNVPEQSLMSLGEIQYLFVYNPRTKRVTRREVRLGQRSPGKAEILDGLKAGEKIIVDGVLKLVDGAEVRVITDEPPAKAKPGKGAGK